MAEPRFQVDLGGVIALLSSNLYSSPGVYVRELLQNAIDALTARDALGGSPGSRTISVSPFAISTSDSPADEFSIHDCGIGINAEQLEQFLATVGASSKRDDLAVNRHDFIGQFGIGLLSCFLIADEITVESRSAIGGAAIRWVGHSDGTYRADEVMDEWPIGTTVRLRPRPDAVGWVRVEQVCALVRKYGEFLPAEVVVSTQSGEQVLTRSFPFRDFHAHRDLVRSGGAGVLYGGVGVGQQFDAIAIDIPATGTTGVVYITDAQRSRAHGWPSRVYVDNLLVTDSDRSMMPEWAFFAWCAINSTGLHPTASRETIVDDNAQYVTQEGIASAIERWLQELADEDPLRFQLFVGAHDSALKDVVFAAPNLAKVLVPELLMETTQGSMRIADIVAQSTTVLYSDTLGDFHRLASLTQQGRLIVNAGYVHGVRIVEAIPSIFPGTNIKYVHPATEIDDLLSPNIENAGDVMAFEARAEAALSDQSVSVVVRLLPDVEMPAAYVSVDEDVPGKLVVNWNNRVIKALASARDGLIFARSMQLLCVQARMIGQYDDETDRRVLSRALDDLIAIAVGVDNGGGEETT